MSDDRIGFLSALEHLNTSGLLSVVKDVPVPELEKLMLKEDQAECPVYHHFGPGVYIREVWLKAGTFAIGHYQKKSQMNVMLKGKVRMLKDGKECLIEAPLMYVGSEGQKMGFIEEDTIWLNIFPNPSEERNIDTLEDMFIDKSEGFKSSKVSCERLEDIEDFKNLVKHFGFDEMEIRNQSENLDDQIPMPDGYSAKLSIRKSYIEGLGLFANAPFEVGEVIAPARICGMRTPAGRFTNHSIAPNCEFIMSDNQDIYLVAKEKILGCMGGGVGTELTVSYYAALELSGIHRVDKCEVKT